jgi:ADP-ribose pyrophosphatase YjhB (NUDIX family)
MHVNRHVLCWREMLNDLLGAIWRRAPRILRRWTIRLWHPRFAVTAGAIVTDARGRVLLLRHRFRPGSGWGVPGGFMETGEQADETLRRELREEIGLEVEKLQLLTTRAFKRSKHVEIIFTARAMGDPAQLSFEIQEAAWFSLNELPRELSKDQAQLIRLALKDGARPQD